MMYLAPRDSWLLQIIVGGRQWSQVQTGGADFRSMASQFFSVCHCLVYFCPCNSTSTSLHCLLYQALNLFGPARSAGPGGRLEALQPVKVLKALELLQRFGALGCRSHAELLLFAELQVGLMTGKKQNGEDYYPFSVLSMQCQCCAGILKKSLFLLSGLVLESVL